MQHDDIDWEVIAEAAGLPPAPEPDPEAPEPDD